ncbi:DUF2285 domain-containing protein [Bradyrhizobium sp. CSA112]|nr:DUF2285 domain-containing protein [Bradyrhizobium sp. CSA112]
MAVVWRSPHTRGRNSSNGVVGNTHETPPLDPDVADSAPDDPVLTGYDEQHLVTYWRLLDAETDGADWKEVARMVLYIDPDREPACARNAFDSHLARAKWMADHGYRDLLRAAARPNSKNLSIRIRN